MTLGGIDSDSFAVDDDGDDDDDGIDDDDDSIDNALVTRSTALWPLDPALALPGFQQHFAVDNLYISVYQHFCASLCF